MIILFRRDLCNSSFRWALLVRLEKDSMMGYQATSEMYTHQESLTFELLFLK